MKEKKNIKVHDLKPSKDAKGGFRAQRVAPNVRAEVRAERTRAGRHAHHHKER